LFSNNQGHDYLPIISLGDASGSLLLITNAKTTERNHHVYELGDGKSFKKGGDGPKGLIWVVVSGPVIDSECA